MSCWAIVRLRPLTPVRREQWDHTHVLRGPHRPQRVDWRRQAGSGEASGEEVAVVLGEMLAWSRVGMLVSRKERIPGVLYMVLKAERTGFTDEDIRTQGCPQGFALDYQRPHWCKLRLQHQANV